MKSSRSAPLPPFRLQQESDRSRRRLRTACAGTVLEAWPTGQGDYFLAGRDTYPIRQRISEAGGRWDRDARRWFVSKEQAQRLGATVLARVLRAPACCERRIDPELSCESLATPREVLDGRMIVRFCPRCESVINEIVAIRDVLDVADLPELPGAISLKAPWED